MRIAQVGPVYPYRGGIAHYTASLENALQAAGHVTRLISFRRQYPAFLYPGESDRDPSQKALRAAAEYVLDPLYPHTWLQGARRIAAFTPDLVVFHWWTTFWGVPYAALAGGLRRGGQRIIFLIHNVLPHEQRFFDRFLARLALRQAHGFIVQTEPERARLLALLPGANTRLCPHPVYTLGRQTGQASEQRRAETRLALGLPETGPVLLFFGIVRPYKGLRVLLHALAELRQRGRQPRLVVAGEFWEDQAEYRALLDQLGIADQVRLEARYIPNEEVERLFAVADALVAPYTGGTQSGAAGIALGCGLPLIVTDKVAAGLPNREGPGLWVAPSGDPAALAGAIASFLDAPLPAPAGRVPAADDWGRLVETLAAFHRPPEKEG